MKKIFLSVFALLSFAGLYADEGMWLPILLKSIEGDMQANGFKLTAEDIYSVNHSSMKDAVVLFGGGCTAEVLSKEGLILTNHHCGFGQVQSHSTVEKDYITNGFWAMNRKEELKNPGLSVTFIVRMEDVTKQVLANIPANLSEAARAEQIKANVASVSASVQKESYQGVTIRPFYYGNEYYLFVTETYNDVRLVGAPPQSIGTFGGDTDNWVWPRHNADFTLFRIYTDAKGKPAEYSESNIPYKPKHSFPISMKGVSENDFTMVYGFPGRTQEYISSYAVDFTMNTEDPTRIKIRDIRLAIMKEDMAQNDTIRIQYASKVAGIANGWKKWKGEVKGLKKVKGLEKKQGYEAEFRKLCAAKNKDYGQYLDRLKEIYATYSPIKREQVYYSEVFSGIENLAYAKAAIGLVAENNPDKPVLSYADSWFKDYSPKTDKRVMKELLAIYFQDIGEKRLPPYLGEIAKKYKGDWGKYVEDYFNKSAFTNRKRFEATFATADGAKKIATDPAVKLATALGDWYDAKVRPIAMKNEISIDSLNRLYMTAQREVMTNKTFYPDANSTLRVTYGKVGGFSPDDGVKYRHFTTLDGMFEKRTDYPTNPDFKILPQLEKIYANKDYGPYADKDGKLHTCFLAANHTTGGNSGSPILNDKGELIGINFDRCWESTMSDINYDVTLCRNISADIRYVLFIIDKYAGAGYLLKEMELVK